MTSCADRLSILSSPEEEPASSDGEPLQVSLRLLKALWQRSAVPVMITNVASGTIQYANEAAAALFETTPDALIGTSTLDDYETPHERRLLMASLQENGVVHNHRLRFRTRNQNLRVLQGSVQPVDFDHEASLLVTFQDVTQEEAVYHQWQRERELLALSSETSRTSFWHWNPDTHEIWWDALHYELFELESGTPVNERLFLSRVHPKDRKRVQQHIRGLPDWEHASIDYEAHLPSGTRRVYRDYTRAVQIGNDSLVLGTCVDITADVQLREELEEKLALMEVASDIARLGFWSGSTESEENWWSESYKRLLQLQEGEPTAFSTFRSRLHPEQRQAQDELAQQADQHAKQGERQTHLYRLLLPDQSERWIRGFVGLQPVQGGKKLIGVAQDVTAQEQQREELAEELEVHKIVNQAAKIGYFKRDPELNRSWMDPYLHELFEIPEEGWFDSDLIAARLTPGSLVNFEQGRIDSAQSGQAEVELELNLPSGTRRFVRSFQRIYQVGGKKVILGISQDITEHVEMWEIIRRNERLYSVGQLAASINHDLRQPLAILNIELNLLDRKVQRRNWHQLEEHITTSNEALAHAGNIMDRSLGMVGKESEASRHRLSRIVLKTLEILKSLLQKQELTPVFVSEWDTCEDEEPWVRAQETELTLVLQNLLINARDAVLEKRHQRLRGPEEVRIELKSGPQQTLHLSVLDRGSGIPEEVIDQIFDPLFSTKTVHNSTGLGLSISRRILRDHQGRIWAENLPSGGAAFHLELPILAE